MVAGRKSKKDRGKKEGEKNNYYKMTERKETFFFIFRCFVFTNDCMKHFFKKSNKKINYKLVKEKEKRNYSDTMSISPYHFFSDFF